jgi:1,2-diacylglycerol 3-alpha-glucosyltransferase
MKILMISDVYFPRVNGVSTSIETFRRNLGQLGHSVHLIAPDYDSVSADESGVTRVPSRRIPFDPEDRFMSYQWVMSKLENLRAENYDIIHVQTPFVAHYLGIKIARLLRIPCVESYHTFFEEYLYHYVPFAPKLLMRFIAKRFSRHQGNDLSGMVVPSKPMLQILRAYGISTTIDVIPTGIEPSSFELGNRVSFREKYEIDQNRPLLLFVGRVAHEKNIGFLLRVIDKLKVSIPDILFVIAGEGPARKSLNDDVEKYGLTENVKFIGYLNRLTELNSCYRASDIFIFSSRTETQGLVLLEAMAQGIPVVSTAELGTRDVLQEGQGVWIAKEDVNDFSSKIIKLLETEKLRVELGQRGRDYTHEWSAAKQAVRLADFYQSIVPEKNTLDGGFSHQRAGTNLAVS